jgi:hypothetical protein
VVTSKKKPLKTFTNKDEGMESYVFESDRGGYNVTMKDLDADEMVPTGFVGIKDLDAAIAKAKKIVRASYDYDRTAAAKDQAGLYHDAKKTYQKLTELMSGFDIEELTETQRDELKLMHRKLNEWAKKF